MIQSTSVGRRVGPGITRTISMKIATVVVFVGGVVLCLSTGVRTASTPTHRPGNAFVIFPGTKWCGKGNKARSYDDLGGADDTDRCCRDHDRAQGGIKVGKTLHNITNNFSYTIKSCEADEKFRRCLREVDSRVSRLVGFFFFNVLRSKCYTLEKLKTCEKRSPNGCISYRTLEDYPGRWRLVENKRF